MQNTDWPDLASCRDVLLHGVYTTYFLLAMSCKPSATTGSPTVPLNILLSPLSLLNATPCHQQVTIPNIFIDFDERLADEELFGVSVQSGDQLFIHKSEADFDIDAF